MCAGNQAAVPLPGGPVMELKDLREKFNSIMAIESNADRQIVLECLVNDVIIYIETRVQPYLRHKYPCSELVVCTCGLSGPLPLSLGAVDASRDPAKGPAASSTAAAAPNSPEWRGERHGR